MRTKKTGTDRKKSVTAENNYDRALRRRRVFELKVQGHTIMQMAGILKINKETVMKDLQAIKGDLMASIDPKAGQQFLAERLRTFQMVIDLAAAKMTTARGNVYIGCLNTISRANSDMIKLLQDVGLIESAPIMVQEKSSDGETTTTTITQDRPIPESHMADLLKRFATATN